MKLEDIGFYTLSEKRAKEASITSNLKRCELLVTDRCNLKCLYCRGIKKELRGDLSLEFCQYVLNLWISNGLENIRFSGGEPTLYPHLKTLIKQCKKGGVKRIAISTNGTQDLSFYEELVDLGVNDFSISLDSGCCAISDKMTGGVKGQFEKVSDNIRRLSWHNYVTVGVVFNEVNISTAIETVKYVDSLNPSDIRIISSAQYNKALDILINLPEEILNRHPILKYRITNYKKGKRIRGINCNDCNKCHLVKDDLAVVGKFHFPCIIYLREGGNPIGEMTNKFRKERLIWFQKHDCYEDKICRKNCLDVCVDYNNKKEGIENASKSKI